MQRWRGPVGVAMADQHTSSAEHSCAALSDSPQEGQSVSHKGKHFTTVKEGLAFILVPENARTSLDPKKTKDDDHDAQSVFYNPIQQFNRDLSVLAIRAYGEDLLSFKQQKSDANRGKKRKRKTFDGVHGTSNGPTATNERETRINLEPKATAETEEVQPTNLPSDPSLAVVSDLGKSDGQGDSDPPVAVINGSVGSGNSAERPQHTKPQRPFKILDALSATGLRALRYAQEIPFVTSVTANDLSREATDSINANVAHNKLDGKIHTVTGNAMSHMYSFVSNPGDNNTKTNKYDVIDLDPYGTAVPFLDGAVQALNDGGLLCVTCTDASIWASCGYLEKTYSQYGGTPLKGLHSHEGGLRLILHAVASSAARYGMSIEPLLSLSIDFYARVFVRVFHSPAEVKFLAGKTMLVYSCDSGCGAWSTQFLARNQSLGTQNGQTTYKHSLPQGPTSSELCDHCGTKTHMSGPMYGGPLHNPKFIETILSQLPTLDETIYGTVPRLEGMLTTALEEILLDDHTAEAEAEAAATPGRPIPRIDPAYVDRHPFYFVPSALAKVVHARAPSEAAIRGALKHAGYGATRSHAKPSTIKTNAPWAFIWEMIREWVRQKAPIKEGSIKQGTAGWRIMRKPGLASSGNNGGGATKPEEDSLSCTASGVDAPPTASEEPSQEQAGGIKIFFDETLGKEANTKRLRRYQENPRANWGPMNRARRGAPTS